MILHFWAMTRILTLKESLLSENFINDVLVSLCDTFTIQNTIQTIFSTIE